MHALISMLLLVLAPVAQATPTAALGPGFGSVPAPLLPWVPWVLRDADWRECPLAPAAQPQGGQQRPEELRRLCRWPGELQIEVSARGARFAQHWRLYAPRWVPLPGNEQIWPQQVQVNGEDRPVLAHQGAPSVWLQPGDYDITGGFLWSRVPDGLQLPQIRGPVRLRLAGALVGSPRIDPSGRLWLAQTAPGENGKAAETAEASNALALDVTRLLADGVPVRSIARLELDVSGEPREITLSGAVLPGALPLRLESPLPTRLNDEGQLQLQVRPGRWFVEVESRYPGRPTRFALDASAPPWPEREVWAFSADPQVRQVEVVGAPAVDPRQTRLPPAWQSYPAYGLESGDVLVLEESSAGQAARERLHLARELWLDFSGRGYSVRDRIQGELAELSRLEAAAPLSLGQVRVDGEPRLITQLPDRSPSPAAGGAEEAADVQVPDQGPDASGSADGNVRAGVEVRGERLDLTADGRFEGLRGQLPASGWAVPLASIHTTLHLPPGWDVLAVSGTDNLPSSWLTRWSLLDLFLVLIASLAVGRLWSWRWGLAALVTLAITWQEPAAPHLLWLHLIGAAALLRLLPAARAAQAQPRALRIARALVQFYFRAALVVMILVAVPFLVGQMRDGLYPQLSVPPARAMSADGITVADKAADTKVAAEPRAAAPAPSALGSRPRSIAPAAKTAPADWNALPPGAVLQTGAGVPDWDWNAFELEWSGPVGLEHRVRLWLIPPRIALMLAVLQLLLIPALTLKMAGGWPTPGFTRRTGPSGLSGHGTNALLAGVGIGLLLGQSLPAVAAPELESAPAPASVQAQRSAEPGAAAYVDTAVADAGAFPPPVLLDDLREHLLKPPECLPECVTLTRLAVSLRDDTLRLRLAVAAGAPGAVPLPGGEASWMPEQVTLDGRPFGLARLGADGSVLVPVTVGTQILELTGPVGERQRIDLPLALRPRLIRTELDPPWQLEGLRADGQAGAQLRLVRQGKRQEAANHEDATSGAVKPSDSPQALTPLLHLERSLSLGLTWELRNRVRRLSPPDVPVSLWLPLWPAEAVTSGEMQVVDDRLLVSLPPGQTLVEWSSRLPVSEHLEFQASQDPRLVESWCIGVSVFWHLQTTGSEPVADGCTALWSASGLPAGPPRLWRPWPGEELELRLTRPRAVPGPTLTLDETRYELTPGRRATEARLSVVLRSSRGGQHRVTLPEGVERLEVRIDGQVRPLARDGRELELPLVPGVQRMDLRWHQPDGLSLSYQPPPLDLGVESVNAATTVHLGANRWVLWTQGPGMGPAVLFWSLLIVLTLIAWGLRRSRLTPLTWFDWLLLAIGLSQADIWVGLVVTAWLVMLGWRRRLEHPKIEHMPAWRFDVTQLALVLLTLVALAGLLGAVQQGLLGAPQMQIAGNGSTASELRWYLDRAPAQLGQGLVISVPMLFYRVLMLAWALWLALRLLDWLRWGWQALSEPLLWRALPRPRGLASGDWQETGRSRADEDLTLDI